MNTKSLEIQENVYYTLMKAKITINDHGKDHTTLTISSVEPRLKFPAIFTSNHSIC